MPQPALHILLAADLLQRWENEAGAPFAAADADLANAFLVGSLGPDLGLFPGGSRVVSRLAHTRATASLLRSLFAAAGTARQRAFAWGWLSHITADVAIHPLVNRAASVEAGRRGRAATLVDHVRVEVGLDAWFGWRHPVLRSLRLRPALARDDWSFVVQAYRETYGVAASPAQLMQMQAGLLRFTRLAAHFSCVAARRLCWGDEHEHDVPAATALLWRLVSSVATRSSTVHAYLNPSRPSPALVADVARGMDTAIADFQRHALSGLRDLPDYDLETGELIADAARDVA